MDVNKVKKYSKNQDGQAIFELIIFIPFILILYTIGVNLFSAINGSINQQKVSRGYFYARVLGNSRAPNIYQLNNIIEQGGSLVGMLALGWRENPFTSANSEPKAPCYKVSSMTASNNYDECEDQFAEPRPTSFIRVKTVYGVCTKTYRIAGNGPIGVDGASNKGSCTIQ